MSPLQTIDGLASNLNTTEIINTILQYERQPAVLLEANAAGRTKELTTFSALSAKLLALQTSITGLQNERAFSQASISISNDDLVSATADGLVTNGTYTINILSLAQNHQLASHGIDDPSQAVMGTGTITLALGDNSAASIVIDEGNNSLVGIKNAINDADLGITAAIINDGSDSRAYRLVLTGDETGRKNEISITSSLTGGINLDFETSAFDDPEILNFSSQSTSQVSLGATAGFTGSKNKMYTFTVGGNGVQTIGNGNIVIDWTDGTDSGSIVVSQADTEVIGPDGMKLTFGGGDLTGGDTFQVSTFAPVLQEAADAVVTLGSGIGGASPLTVRSETNQIENFIPNVTLDLKGVTSEATGPVTIQTGLDTDGVVDKIKGFISAYNDVKNFIDDQNSFNSDTEEAGVLLGDLTLMTIQARLSGVISRPIAGLEGKLTALSSIGIRTNASGQLAIKDTGLLSESLKEDFNAVLELFVDSGHTSTEAISFLNASTKIDGGTEFDVDITQAATHGYLQSAKLSGGEITLDSTNNHLKFRVDGIVSEEIVLTPRTYASGADLARELQTKINADDKIGRLGVGVEWVDVGGEGYLKFTSSSYGSTSKVEMIASVANNAYSDLGLTNGYMMRAGEDVAGTINGEAATGRGQILTGNDGNATTDGLRLKISLGAADLGFGSEGTITVTRGFASAMTEVLDSITKSGEGVLARKTSALQKQVDNYKDQIDSIDERLEIRRRTLVEQWAEFEAFMSQLQSEQSFLTSQLANIEANTNQILKKG